MASDIELYLLESDKAKAKEVATQSAHRLHSKDLRLIDLITSLEPYINNREDVDIRTRTLGYLADTLAATEARVLSGQERRLLVDFIVGRLEGDTEGIGSSARALLALESLGKWDAETAQKVMQAFLDNTHPLRQFKLQTERFAVVQLVDLLLGKYRDAERKLHESDAEFMPTFISYFEGEKDPRNLMIIFSFLQVPMTEWDVHAYAQDLFGSVFNYFPITFKPPPDDPYGITAQDLKDRLRDCIAANSDFAPYAFPQLLDKLDSTSMNTKRDVLQALQACVTGYEANTINLYSVTLWDALKFEVLNVQEEDLAVESLKVLALMGGKLSTDAEGQLNAYLRPVIKECNEHLEDAPTKQSEATGRILYSLAGADPAVADKIAKGILPTLLSLYHGSESITKRRGLIEVFNQIATASYDLGHARPGARVDALQSFSDEAVQAMVRAVVSAPKAEVSFRLASLDGLVRLSSLTGVLSDEQQQLAVSTVTDVILREQIEGHGDIRVEAIKALAQLAHSAPHAVQGRTIPAFMVQIPDNVPESQIPGAVLEAFAQLATERQVFDTVVRRLKAKVSAARHQGAPLQYQRALLLAMLFAFTFGSPLQEDGVLRSSYYTDYAAPLVQDFVRGDVIHADANILDIIGRICNAMLRSQGVHFQSTVYNADLEWIAGTAGAAGEAPAAHLTPFLLYYYAAIRPEVADATAVIGLLKVHAEYVLVSGDQSVNSGAVLRLLSLLINKFINPKTMQETLSSAGLEVETLLQGSQSVQAVTASFVVVKALLIQGKTGTLANKYLQALLKPLANSEREIARRFTTLLAPDDILTKDNHCLVSGLYKQKIFGQTVPVLSEAVRTADAAKKPNYLIALSGILRWLPYSIIEPSLPDLVPALLQTLDLEDPADQEIKASALTIFESVLMHNPDVLSEHTSSVVTRLLNSTSAPANYANVRVKALQSLTLVPRQLKREAVVPHRRRVVKRLMACLDDGKRNVRAEAVRCRTAWLALDEDVDDEE